MRGRVIWGNISRSVNGENVLGGVAYKLASVASPVTDHVNGNF